MTQHACKGQRTTSLSWSSHTIFVLAGLHGKFLYPLNHLTSHKLLLLMLLSKYYKYNKLANNYGQINNKVLKLRLT